MRSSIKLDLNNNIDGNLILLKMYILPLYYVFCLDSIVDGFYSPSKMKTFSFVWKKNLFKFLA